MEPILIITVAVILIAFLIFAKFVYPKILEKKHIEFSDKTKAFLDLIDISYNNSQIVYAEQKKNKGDTAAKLGKQLALGIAGIQDYTDFVKYVIVYNMEHIVFIPICVSELSGNIILCEENNETIQDIKISQISKIEVNRENSMCEFEFNNIKKSIYVPDRAVPYEEQKKLKNSFMNFAEENLKTP